MTYEQFWYDDPCIVVYYRKKYYFDLQEKNFLLWLNGLYIQNAYASVLSNAFSKNSKAKYIDKPIDIIPKTEQELESERKKQQQIAIAELTKWADRWNKT